MYLVVQIRNYLLYPSALGMFEEGPRGAAGKLTLGATDGVSMQELNTSLWSSQRIKAYEASLTSQFAPPVAVLPISGIGLVVPLLEETDDLLLNIGVGRIQSRALGGARQNVGIAGHRDDFFRELKNISLGDIIELNTPPETLTYTADQIEIVRPENVEVMHERGYPSLTLVTCFPFYYAGDAPKRFIVHAALKAISQQPTFPAPTTGSDSIIRTKIPNFRV